MSKIFLFMMVSVDGYFEDKDHDLSWHSVDGLPGQDRFTELILDKHKQSLAVL